MKIIFRLLLLLVPAALLSSCNLNNDIISRNVTQTVRPVPPFSMVDIRDGFQVDIVKGSPQRVIIELPEELQRYAYADVFNGELKISLDKSIDPRSVNIKRVQIFMPYLNSILASNGSEVYSPDAFNTSIFNIDVDNGAYVKANIFTDKLDAIATNDSDIEVQGEAGTLFVKEISNNSRLLAFRLQADNADLLLFGRSLAEVNTRYNLTVDAADQSTVRFIGYPTIYQKLSGGSVIIDSNR